MQMLVNLESVPRVLHQGPPAYQPRRKSRSHRVLCSASASDQLRQSSVCHEDVCSVSSLCVLENEKTLPLFWAQSLGPQALDVSQAGEVLTQMPH